MPTAEELTKQAEDYAQSDAFRQLLPYLLSGGAGALGGALMTGRRRRHRDEGRLGYLGRVLRNALVVGGLAGGAHALLGQGLSRTMGGLTEGATGTAGNEGPLAATTKNILFSPVTAAGAGGAALLATHGRPLIGAGDPSNYVNRLSRALGGLGKNPNQYTPEWLRSAAPAEINEVMRRFDDPANPAARAAMERIRRGAGLASSHIGPGNNVGNLLLRLGMSQEGAETAKGFLSSARRNLLGTLGNTPGRTAWRGGLGLTAAAIPAMVGSYITSDTRGDD